MTDVVDKTASIIKDNVTGQYQKISSMVSETGESLLKKPQTNNSNFYTKLAIGFFILALLGINIFGYASVLTDTISDTFGKPFRDLGRYLGFYTGETIKQTAELSAEGTKFGADVAKDVVVNTVDAVSEQAKNTDEAIQNIDTAVIKTPQENEEEREMQQIPYIDRNDLMTSFDNAIKDRPKLDKYEGTFVADDAGSMIQNGVVSNQGWCYVGEDRGYRSCVEVGRGHECMSGDVFPTKDICINPNLRE